MMLRKVLFFLSLALIGLSSCSNNPHPPDHHAYHNPLVQPLTEAIQSDPGNAALYFQRAGTLMQIHEDSLALLDLKQALSLDSNNVKYQGALGMVYLQLAQPNEAIRAFHKNLRQAPGSVPVRLMLSKAYLKNRQPKEALQQINKILAADPHHPGALFQKAKIRMAQEDTARAISLLQQVVGAAPRYYEAALLLGDWYAMQDAVQTIPQYEQVFLLDTMDVTPLFRIGRYWQQKQQPTQAKAAYRRCILKDPDFSAAYYETGKILVTQDSIRKALRQFVLTIKTSPANAEAYLQKGLCYERLHRPDSAEKAFRQALVFNHRLQEAQSGLSRVMRPEKEAETTAAAAKH